MKNPYGISDNPKSALELIVKIVVLPGYTPGVAYQLMKREEVLGVQRQTPKWKTYTNYVGWEIFKLAGEAYILWGSYHIVRSFFQ